MLPHPLTNFEKQKYQNEPKLNGIYSRKKNKIKSKKKNGVYIINFDEYESIAIHWIALYVNFENLTYFDSFGVEYIFKKIITKFIGNKNIKTNIYRTQAYESIRCEYFCIGFIDFM